MSPATDDTQLARLLGFRDAVLLGLGSILGTGVFVSLGLAADLAGNWTLLAVVLAAGLAGCSGMSAAQLAAVYPSSGGTYEFGTRLLSPSVGFVAGWMFLCSKSASAATAALGLAGYLALAAPAAWTAGRPPVLSAVVVVVGLTVLVRSGVKRTALINAVLVAGTLLSLAVFCGLGLVASTEQVLTDPEPRTSPWTFGLLEATALIFVAFAGYARIATLGEEVRDPEVTIPRAILTTLIIAAGLYALVVVAALSLTSAEAWAESAQLAQAPLATIVLSLDWATAGWWAFLIACGAVTALLGVLLNLILGLSRMVLAMSRRGDLPRGLAHISGDRQPARAVWVVGLGTAGLVLLGDVKVTWSLSAFTVLVYYSITNLAALRLPRAQRRYPASVAWVGLAACLTVAFFVEPVIWISGLGLIAGGFVVRWIVRWHDQRRTPRSE